MAGLSQEFLFRDLFNEDRIAGLGSRLEGASPDFDRDGFVRRATRGLDGLGMFERSRQITDALTEYLPEEFPEAVRILLAALGPESPDPGKTDWDSFIVLPQCGFVARHGAGHFDLSMNALYEMTKRDSAEFDLRTFLELDFDRTMERLAEWTADASPHVRRLVSEGTRPRLPLAAKIRRFVADPAPVIGLLELLREDPSDYVRRSVANNLNDISKDHPERALDVLERWNRAGHAGTDWIVRRAARGLLKQGRPRAIALFGYTASPSFRAEVKLSSEAVTVGDKLSFQVRLISTARVPQKLLLDYVIHFRKAAGKTAPKVFKWTSREIGAGETVEITRAQLLRPTSGRKLYPGAHALALQINGVEQKPVPFELQTSELPPG